MKVEMQIKPMSIGILMMIYTSIAFFSTMIVYWLMLLFSFLLVAVIKKRESIRLFAFYILLFAIIWLVPSRFFYYGWLGALYTMGLIVLKLFPIWILAVILSGFGTSTIIYSLRSIHLPNYLCIGVAVFFRFIPEYREYLSEIKEGLKARNISITIFRPIYSLELYLVPMIYKAFETGSLCRKVLQKGL